MLVLCQDLIIQLELQVSEWIGNSSRTVSWNSVTFHTAVRVQSQAGKSSRVESARLHHGTPHFWHQGSGQHAESQPGYVQHAQRKKD